MVCVFWNTRWPDGQQDTHMGGSSTRTWVAAGGFQMKYMGKQLIRNSGINKQEKLAGGDNKMATNELNKKNEIIST